MEAQCSTGGILFGKVVTNLCRWALLPRCAGGPQMSTLRHPLRKRTIKFIYLKKIVSDIWEKIQKDINIKESKCGMFEYRELSWESKHKVLKSTPKFFTLKQYRISSQQAGLPQNWEGGEVWVPPPLGSSLLAMFVHLHFNWASLL